MNRDKTILKEFIVNHSTDTARLLEQMTFEQVYSLIEKISTDLAVILFCKMDVFLACRCIEKLEVGKSLKIIEALPANLAASFLRRVDKEKREEILIKSEPSISRLLGQMLYHSENSAGALMNPHAVVIPEDLNVKEAVERVKKSKHYPLSYLYVVNPEGRLSGMVKIEDLITSESKEQITKVMDSEFLHLFPELDLRKIKNHPGWLEYNELPVLDRSGIFLGAINQSVIKKLESDGTKKVPEHAMLAGTALGELYRIGLSGLFNSALAINKKAE